MSEETKKKISEANMGRKGWNKGIPCTEEVKIKISESLKGEKHPNYGEHRSKETKEKISKNSKGKSRNKGENHPLYGKSPSKETREKMSKAMSGENSPNFGKHLPEETRKKISESLSGENHPNFGKHLSEETRKKISESKIGENNPMFGKHFSHSEETKRKISNTEKGKIISIETREKLSEINTGENHPNWKGGISFDPYCSKFNNQFKEKIRDEFNRECFICGKSEEQNRRKLCVHHVNYNKDCLCGNFKCFFVPLCSCCHTRTNQNRDFWGKLLTICCQDQEMSKYFTNENESPIKISVKSNIIAEIDNYL